MKTMYPDYKNSIVNLACSVLKYYNVPDIKHPSLPYVDSILESRKPRNVVLMLFDAMGISILKSHLPKDSFTRTHIIRPITSTFPPTTVAATTSINTGLTPVETGWLGWVTYFKEVDSNVITFFNTIQNTDKQASERHLAYCALPYKSLSMQIREVNPNVKCTAISPFKVNVTDPTIISKSVKESCEQIINLTNEPSQHFIYSYWDNPDYLMHEFGVDDTKHITPILKDIDENLERLSKAIGEDTVILVTADHSQINSEWDYFSDHPDLRSLLIRDHSLETRAASLFVKEGCNKEFEKFFKKYMGDNYILMSHEEFMKSGLLGTGVPHPRTEGFIGDYVAIATGKRSIEDDRANDIHIGMHAGLTEEEMLVPLILL